MIYRIMRKMLLMFLVLTGVTLGEKRLLVLTKVSTFEELQRLGKAEAKKGMTGVLVKIGKNQEVLPISFPVINPPLEKEGWMNFLSESAARSGDVGSKSFNYFEVVVNNGAFFLNGRPVEKIEKIFDGSKKSPCVAVKISPNENMSKIHNSLCLLSESCEGRMMFYDK